MDIRTGELRCVQVMALLQAHHEDMLRHSPAESVHAFDVSALEAPSVTFWSVWLNDELAGIGALNALDNTHGEIKSMRTSVAHKRKGVARTLLNHIIAHSKACHYQKISLETGTAEAFLPAQTLYRACGFRLCQPFAHYQADPFSVFMTKDLR